MKKLLKRIVNLFRKNKEVDWDDVTLAQFKKLQEALKIEDESEKVIAIAEVIYGDDITDLPVTEFNKKVKALSKLKGEIPVGTLRKKLEINGRKYKVDCLVGNISTAQYVDYINHSRTNDLAKMLSVFVVPEGHKYNDGYDMLEVISDMDCLPITVVNAIAFFFVRQLAKFMEIFQSYSIRQIKKMKITKEQKKKLIEVVKYSMDFLSFPLS